MSQAQILSRQRKPPTCEQFSAPSAGRTDGERYALRVLKAGAAGYLTKESAPDDLMTALRKVAAGGKYVSPTLAERLPGYKYREQVPGEVAGKLRLVNNAELTHYAIRNRLLD